MAAHRLLRSALIVTTGALMSLASMAHAATPSITLFLNQLIRCEDTGYSSNYGVYYAATGPCGAPGGDGHEVIDVDARGDDPLDNGEIHILADGSIEVVVQGAQPFSMYEVYWHPLGTDPTDPLTTINAGNFLTDDQGDANAKLRDIFVAVDAAMGTLVDFRSRVGTVGVGHFLVFSRGPYGSDTDSDGRITDGEYNSHLNSPAGHLNNPVTDLECGLVQFVSGVRVSVR
jgi:hypothetical protein